MPKAAYMLCIEMTAQNYALFELLQVYTDTATLQSFRGNEWKNSTGFKILEKEILKSWLQIKKYLQKTAL